MANKEVIWAPGGWRKRGGEHLRQVDSTLSLLKAASAGLREGASLKSDKIPVLLVSLSPENPTEEQQNL